MTAKTEEESIDTRIKIEQDRRLKRTEEFKSDKMKYQMKKGVLGENSQKKRRD